MNLGLDDDLHDIASCVVRHLDTTMDGFGFESVDSGAGMEAPSGKWQRRLWDYLKGEDGPVPREELLSAVAAQEPRAADTGRDTRKQNARRALDDMLADGLLTPSGPGIAIAVHSGRLQQAVHHLHQTQHTAQIH